MRQIEFGGEPQWTPYAPQRSEDDKEREERMRISNALGAHVLLD